jgi:hypothetical protein
MSDMRPKLDFTINIGNIISVVVLIIMLFQMNNKVVEQLTDMKLKVDMMWQTFSITAKNR